jgi:hypothetical protein
VPSTYQPRRPRAAPLWQIVHHGWDAFLADYEKRYRKDLGPLHPAATATVESFLRCGDLASGFTRLQCPDCGHERLLAFTCILLRARLRKDRRAATSVHPATILRFRAGSFEWQAIGELREAKNALRSLGEEGPSATKFRTANLSSPFPKSYAASSANAANS